MSRATGLAGSVDLLHESHAATATAGALLEGLGSDAAAGHRRRRLDVASLDVAGGKACACEIFVSVPVYTLCSGRSPEATRRTRRARRRPRRVERVPDAFPLLRGFSPSGSVASARDSPASTLVAALMGEKAKAARASETRQDLIEGMAALSEVAGEGRRGGRRGVYA